MYAWREIYFKHFSKQAKQVAPQLDMHCVARVLVSRVVYCKEKEKIKIHGKIGNSLSSLGWYQEWREKTARLQWAVNRRLRYPNDVGKDDRNYS